MAGGVHGGLGNADHRSPRHLAGGVQAGVAEAGDDVAVDVFVFAKADRGQQTRHAHRLVVVAFDGRRAAFRRDAGDRGAGCDDRPRAARDRCGHRLGGVRVDDPDLRHGIGATAILVLRVASR
jgi:hypothetical protein